MTPAFLDATALGWISGVVGTLIALALVISLTVVRALVISVGGRPGTHVANIADNLDAVARHTDPVPMTLTDINAELAEVAVVLRDVAGHLAVARQVFEAQAGGR